MSVLVATQIILLHKAFITFVGMSVATQNIKIIFLIFFFLIVVNIFIF